MNIFDMISNMEKPNCKPRFLNQNKTMNQVRIVSLFPILSICLVNLDNNSCSQAQGNYVDPSISGIVDQL